MDIVRPYRADKAFTLVEIMVVVAIVGILATLAISMVLRNYMTSNETVAISACKTIISACQSYYVGTSPHRYPASLNVLGGSGLGPAYIDELLASRVKSGYRYTYRATTPVTFTLGAEPVFPGRTGGRYFFADETGKITASTTGPAGPDDPAI